jgi:hypothetical protein
VRFCFTLDVSFHQAKLLSYLAKGTALCHQVSNLPLARRKASADDVPLYWGAGLSFCRLSWQLLSIAPLNVGLCETIGTLTCARHPGPALTTLVRIPNAVRVVFAHPPEAEADGAVLIDQSVSGVRRGEDLSSVRNSCWAK